MVFYINHRYSLHRSPLSSSIPTLHRSSFSPHLSPFLSGTRAIHSRIPFTYLSYLACKLSVMMWWAPERCVQLLCSWRLIRIRNGNSSKPKPDKRWKLTVMWIVFIISQPVEKHKLWGNFCFYFITNEEKGQGREIWPIGGAVTINVINLSIAGQSRAFNKRFPFHFENTLCIERPNIRFQFTSEKYSSIWNLDLFINV